MTLLRTYTLLLILFIAAPNAHGQMMQGKIYDIDGKKPLKDVIIHNIFSEEIVYSDENGRFRIEVKPGELVEFKMYNYKTSRVRIHNAPAS